MKLISPVPASWWPILWAWLQEDTIANLDDSAPTTCDQFAEKMDSRQWILGERLFGVTCDDEPVGVIGFMPISDRVGAFHGICFTRSVHGSSVTRDAVRRVLDVLVMDGYVKIQACFFAHNRRVARFLAHLGFEEEGRLRAQTTQQGCPVDMILVARFVPEG